MGRDRAAYMREYRASRRPEPPDGGRIATSPDLARAHARIGELEAEVRQLKQQLAVRLPSPIRPTIRFGSPSPAPKPPSRSR